MDDYIKLIETLKLTNNKKYFLQNNDTDTEFYKGYSKLRVNETIYEEKYYRDSKIHHGISLEIFPLDKIGINTFQSKVKFLFIKIGSSILLANIIIIPKGHC